MAQAALRVGLIGLTNLPDSDGLPAAVSGAGRSWFRTQRTEPFLAAVSIGGPAGYGEQMAAQLATEFRGATRYSVTTSLNRALRSAHTNLATANRRALPDQQRRAAAVLAAVRPDGVHVARCGPALVASIRRREVWARSGDPTAPMQPQDGGEMGHDLMPHVTTELFPLEEGDAIILIPGVTVSEVADQALSAALHAPLDLDRVSALLNNGPSEWAGFVIWCPRATDDEPDDERWIEWTKAKIISDGSRLQAEPATSDTPADTATASNEIQRATRTTMHEDPEVEAAGDTRSRAPQGIFPLGSWAKLIPLIPLAVLLLFAIALVRGVIPMPRGPDHTVGDAGRIIQQAGATQDEEIAADLLTEAINLLRPREASDEAARALLIEARESRDRVRRIHRVSRVQRLMLPSSDSARPAGIWKGSGAIFMLDFGSQLLYRTDVTGTQLLVTLRPADSFEGQPLGRLVSVAWSPARGTNTEGQLLVVDHLRSVISLNPSGSTARRWWPVDNSRWDRIGPSAATYDDLYLLDSGRGEVLRYPARLAGVSSTVVADATHEPRIASAIDMVTDGNLYLLLSDGSISKLAPGGGRLPFEPKVPDDPLMNPTALFANPELDHIWVLEAARFRVIELTNDGSYVRQFVFPADIVRNAVGFHVDPAAGELRVLTPQAILSVQIDQ